jgi:hypothetical protein
MRPNLARPYHTPAGLQHRLVLSNDSARIEPTDCGYAARFIPRDEYGSYSIMPRAIHRSEICWCSPQLVLHERVCALHLVLAAPNIMHDGIGPRLRLLT